MSILKHRANLKFLESELEGSIKADELYKLQNDAKIRAIEQRVPTYEHFRNMVHAAHLKPLKQSELQKVPEIRWNHCYTKSTESVVHNNQISFKHHTFKLSDVQIPQNSMEFLNIWKCISVDEEKLAYLLKFRDDLKDKYFKMEVPSEFIKDFIQLSLTNCSVETVSQIIDILQVLSECNRFTLNLCLILGSKSNSLYMLFEKMLNKSKRIDEINKIESLMKKCNFF